MWFKRSILITHILQMIIEWETNLCTLMSEKCSQCCSCFLWIAAEWWRGRRNAWTHGTEFHSQFTSVVWGCRSRNDVQVLGKTFYIVQSWRGVGIWDSFLILIVSNPILSFSSKNCLAFMFPPQVWREYALCCPRHFCIPRRLEMGPAASPGSSNFGPKWWNHLFHQPYLYLHTRTRASATLQCSGSNPSSQFKPSAP